MSDSDPQILSLFCEAVEHTSPEERAAYLDKVCRGDAGLRARIETLLRAHQEAGSFLQAGSDPFATKEETIRERPGTVIGPYKLLEEIGEGGFGVVFMAEQQHPLRRKVALKVIKPGMDTRQVIARFEAERQALALMDHPNIARVFDAGATGLCQASVEPSGLASLEPSGPASIEPSGLASVEPSGRREKRKQPAETRRPDGSTLAGRPYFVMELVRGLSMTEYCDQHNLPVRERLELFIDVCLAVQHAHQKGIIHRDIKPSNVLVTLHDGKPVVKVIDFGIAKAMGQQLTEKTLFTNFAQMIGTPLYMSPEQAEMSGLDIDTRGDIYSLGVMLYELLTGTTPFEKDRFRQAGFDEIRRIIREEDPPKPSTRMSTVGQAATTASEKRQSDPWKLSRLFRGELDWIVMKCLEKDRNRRYETASAFAADVQRYLADEPVQACPPTAMYRFRKFARRNRAALATASLVGLAVLLAVVVLATSMVLIAREQQATQTAQQAEARSEDDRKKAVERERRESYFHSITLAHRDLALELLAACPEDLREWEWHYLMRLCRVEPLVIRDTTEANGVAFSPDGERLASAGGDGTIKIWNSRTGDVVQTIKNAHTKSVLSVAFHRDGKHVASAGTDQQVKVWDLRATDQPVFTHPCNAIRMFGAAYTVAFSPDGRQLAAGSDGAVRVWDWKNDQLLHTFPGHRHHSIPVAFRGDGRCLATSAWPNGLKLWNLDLETGRLPLRTFPDLHPVSALAFSPDGEQLASASYSRSVNLWATTTGELLRTFVHTGNVECVAFSPDGRRLASAGEDKTVRVWDATTGREVLGLRGHADRCVCVAFSPDGRRLVSASTDGTIRVWDATPLQGNEGQEILTFTGHTAEIRSLAVSPDGQRIASSSQTSASAGLDTTLKVWDAATGQVMVEFSGVSAVVFGVAWHGERIAAVGALSPRNSVKVWNARNGREVFELPPGSENYYSVAFSPDGRYLVTGGGLGALQVWDAGTGREVGTTGTHDREIRGVVFSRDGNHLASASGDGKVKLWDALRLHEKQQARLTLRARVPGPSLNVAFSPDGRRLATGGDKNTVKIWDVQNGQELKALEGHSGEVYTVAFSPVDGRWVASGGEDSTVKVWDSHTGDLVRSFRAHRGLVSSLAFSPDGRQLFSGSRDKTVKVWDVSQLNKVPDR